MTTRCTDYHDKDGDKYFSTRDRTHFLMLEVRGQANTYDPSQVLNIDMG